MAKEFQDKVWCIQFSDLNPGDCFILPMASYTRPVPIFKKTKRGCLCLSDDGRWKERGENKPFSPETSVIQIRMPTQIIVKM